MKLTFNLVAMAMLASTAFAHESPHQKTPESMIRVADFVFEGIVKNIEYKMSEPAEGEETGLPHTFVTYEILKIMKGKAKNNWVTLRFLGGRGKEAAFLYPSNYPLFDLGDHDILFVKGNTVSSCPLVGCADGRFRVIEDRKSRAKRIFDERGYGLVEDDHGNFTLGRREKLEEVLTHKVSNTVIRDNYVEEGNEEGRRERDRDQDPKLERAFLHERFSQMVHERVGRVHKPEELRRMPEVRVADPRGRFSSKLHIGQAGMRAQKPVIEAPRSPEERTEAEELLRNNGNPVLRGNSRPEPRPTFTRVPRPVPTVSGS